MILNGRDLDPVSPVTRERFIFSAGRVWDEAKNFELLDQVAREAAWPILVAGETSRNGSPAKLQNLCLLGQLSQSEIRNYYQSASIFVSPAFYEPFGLCILEAALAGCPLILSDLDSLREVWQDNALFVEPGDAEQLKRAINQFIEDEVMRQVYGMRAQTKARQYTAERMADTYLSLYRQIKTNKPTASTNPELRSRLKLLPGMAALSARENGNKENSEIISGRGI